MQTIDKSLEQAVLELQVKIANLEKNQGTIPKAPNPFPGKVRMSHGRPFAPGTLSGIYPAVCVDTRDPWKIGRIMVYCPIIHNLKDVAESNLSWASPCSPFGSIDDVGSVFIPPEGSLVLIMFENGSRGFLYYIGCTWIPKKTSPEIDQFSYNPIREKYRWNNFTRNEDVKCGLTDSLMPPWNNESYFGNDLTPTISSDKIDITAKDTRNIDVVPGGKQTKTSLTSEYSTQGWRSTDMPHIYGIKTPEKHFIIFDDGSYEREKKLWGKRLVLQSSKSHILIMKDDNDKTAEEIYNHTYWDSKNDSLSTGDHPFNKIGNQHAVELNHTGVQLQSFGGGRLIIDDKIFGDLDENQNSWKSIFPPRPKNGPQLYRTMIRLESHTEHRITLSDHHVNELGQRSDKDGIFLSTACGHYIGMVDQTDNEGKAGKDRKILIKSTSGHEISLNDFGCALQSKMVRNQARYTGKNQRDYRDENVYDKPIFNPMGKGFPEQVCMKFKSGFGQYLLFEDGMRQNKPTNQFVILSNARGKNGPRNFFQMNQITENKLVHLFCAGDRRTTVKSNYFRDTSKSENLRCIKDQNHVVIEGNMIDTVEKGNLSQFIALGNHTIFCKEGKHFTYAFKGTTHACFSGKHMMLGGIPPEGGKPEPPPAAVLLAGGRIQGSHASSFLMAN